MMSLSVYLYSVHIIKAAIIAAGWTPERKKVRNVTALWQLTQKI
jgi:hypothetical protein